MLESVAVCFKYRYFSQSATSFLQSVELRPLTSAISPLTEHGTIVVDDVMASCYAMTSNHQGAHLALTWARGLYWLGAELGLTNRNTGMDQRGPHWSANAMMKLFCWTTSQQWPWCPHDDVKVAKADDGVCPLDPKLTSLGMTSTRV